MDETFMHLAIEEARKSLEPLKCGVIVVKNGEVVVRAHNTQRLDHNAGAHAEMNAIRLAGQKLGSKDLVDCDFYCTSEPCSMCLSALSYAKVRKIYFGASLPEKAVHKPILVENFMEKECVALNHE